MPDIQPDRAIHKKTKYSIIGRALEVLAIVLLAVIAVIPGVLHIMYRADAQVALGNAKLVRTALEMTALEAYADNRPLHDPTSESGVTKEAYRNILMAGKIPGDFQVVQVDESGYKVRCFYYREGDYIVICRTDPISYEVLHAERFIDTQSDEE
ncbi:hypothetical protein ABXS75_08310 [Roseburia hominis]